MPENLLWILCTLLLSPNDVFGKQAKRFLAGLQRIEGDESLSGVQYSAAESVGSGGMDHYRLGVSTARAMTHVVRIVDSKLSMDTRGFPALPSYPVAMQCSERKPSECWYCWALCNHLAPTLVL